MTDVMMVFVCGGFAACGSDDDDDNGGGGGGNNGAVIDGKTLNTSYAFWNYMKSDKTWSLYFCNVDIRNLGPNNFPSSGINIVSYAI